MARYVLSLAAIERILRKNTIYLTAACKLFTIVF